jgi:hypothetical protein
LPLNITDALEAPRADLGSRVLIGRGFDQGPQLRLDPYPPLRADWESLHTFMFTTAATSTESQTGRDIYGPFQLIGIQANIQNVASELASIAVSITDSDAEPTALAALADNITHEFATDGTFAGNVLPWQTSNTNLPLGYVHRGQKARLTVLHINPNAATRVCQVIIRLAHLCPVTPGAYL